MTDLFICPVCGYPLLHEENRLVCTNTSSKKTHSFDLSAAGYVNLAPPSKPSGDNKAMVKARSEFLSAGYYEPVADALCDAVRDYASPEPVILDAGCGEGYYTNKLSAISKITVGIDLSKEAITAGAKAAKRENIRNRVSYAVAGIFEMPLKSESFDVIVSLFAPIDEDEFSRVLRDNGILICVCAGPKHLMGLKNFLYSETYENTSRADLPRGFELIKKRHIEYTMEVKSNEHVYDLFTMTPYFYRTPKEASERLKALDKLQTPVEVDIFIYRKNPRK